MKIGGLHGSPQEIKAFFKNSGLQIENYIERPMPAIAVGWIVAPSVLYAVCLAVQLLARERSQLLSLALIVGLAAAVWVSVIVQLRYRNTLATLLAVIGLPLIILVAAGLMTPVEALDRLRELRK